MTGDGHKTVGQEAVLVEALQTKLRYCGERQVGDDRYGGQMQLSQAPPGGDVTHVPQKDTQKVKSVTTEPLDDSGDVDHSVTGQLLQK